MQHYLASINEKVECQFDSTQDSILASWCTQLACERHAGRLETSYTPMGVFTFQSGKDLSEVKIIIGIGGPLIHSRDPKSILNQSLRKSHSPEILLPKQSVAYLDTHYVISCLGLLASRHPDTVVRLLKRNVEIIL